MLQRHNIPIAPTYCGRLNFGRRNLPAAPAVRAAGARAFGLLLAPAARTAGAAGRLVTIIGTAEAWYMTYNICRGNHGRCFGFRASEKYGVAWRLWRKNMKPSGIRRDSTLTGCIVKGN